MNPITLANLCLQTIQHQLQLPEIAVLVARDSALIAAVHTRGFCLTVLEQDWQLEYNQSTDNVPWLQWQGVDKCAVWVYPIFFHDLLVGTVLLRTENTGFTFEHHHQLLLLCSYQFATPMHLVAKGIDLLHQ
jgi:hypothetical protein